MDSRFSRAKFNYGLTSEVFVNWQEEGKTIILGGKGSEANTWTQSLTPRAAHQLWFQLTRLLFPEKSMQVTGMAQTAPLAVYVPRFTTRFEIVTNPETHTFDILGWIDDEAWWCRVDDHTARSLWTALDLALYPAGWSGPITYHRRPGLHRANYTSDDS
jgi:hypothetical protein